MTLQRVVEPEWLDTLPCSDPAAERSRRDLRRINFLMGNAGMVARELARHFRTRAPHALADVGSGDGTFMLRVAGSIPPAWRNLSVTLLDRQDAPSPRTREGLAARLGEVKGIKDDALEWLAREGHAFDAIVTNLFLHHFEGRDLERLLALIASRTSLFIACEPRRSAFALAGSRLLGLAGCGAVTRHDAVVSVQAGFRGDELSALWPAGWATREWRCGPFSHGFVAGRGDAPL